MMWMRQISTMFSRWFVLACVGVAAVGSVGCGGKEEAAPCVATGGVTLSRTRAAIGSPLTLTYSFDVAPTASIQGDYWVFVHVLDEQGESLWGDDHQPAVPTSAWKGGQKVEYSRTVFIPSYPYIGAANIRLGLYQPGSDQRLPLCNAEVSRREYEIAKFQLLAQSENIFLIYKEGWHAAEFAADNPTVEWQWTKKTATISFKNPKKDATFYLEYDARADQFSPAQQVSVRSGDQVFGTFTADARNHKLVSFPVTAAQLGTGDMSEITIEVDRTFTPGGADTRELGIRIFHAFVEPK
jgi:hypothetical protein